VVVRLRPRRLVLPALLGGGVARVAVTAAAEAQGDPLAASLAVPQPYGPLIAAAARREGVPESLLAAQLQIESGFDPRAVSPAGAQGIAQFMPGTWGGGWNPWRSASPFDAAAAIAAQARLMAGLLGTFGGRPELALAAYNAGAARARQPAATWPAETRAYVPAVLALAGAGGGRAQLVR
jgi:soluble lytic murein transglycosylase-like protein